MFRFISLFATLTGLLAASPERAHAISFFSEYHKQQFAAATHLTEVEMIVLDQLLKDLPETPGAEFIQKFRFIVEQAAAHPDPAKAEHITNLVIKLHLPRLFDVYHLATHELEEIIEIVREVELRTLTPLTIQKSNMQQLIELRLRMFKRSVSPERPVHVRYIDRMAYELTRTALELKHGETHSRALGDALKEAALKAIRLLK